MTAEPIRVLVVDDQRLIRESIASLLALQPGIAVVGTAANGREAVERAVTLAADVVLMDVRMPELDGIAALELLRRRAPGCRVVMLTTFDDEDYVVPALRAGATGYLLKDLPARELGVTAATLAEWRDQFLAGGQSAVRSRPTDARDEDLARLRAKIGELTMENELLRERAQRAEAGHPFASGRSRP